jgi:hypothetical protein
VGLLNSKISLKFYHYELAQIKTGTFPCMPICTMGERIMVIMTRCNMIMDMKLESPPMRRGIPVNSP